ncbi:MAG TPA: DUF424 family protein [Candidatus Thermoplasmatota archaeon]|nr:DUF424 family protein [Candidatus Thermoplasmatota archaeon]
MFVFKVYQRGAERVLAACDAAILGQEFREGEIRLRVLEGFYGGERIERRELAAQLRVCTIANLVGNEAVAVAVELGLVDPQRVLRVGGVAHAQLAKGL